MPHSLTNMLQSHNAPTKLYFPWNKAIITMYPSPYQTPQLSPKPPRINKPRWHMIPSYITMMTLYTHSTVLTDHVPSFTQCRQMRHRRRMPSSWRGASQHALHPNACWDGCCRRQTDWCVLVDRVNRPGWGELLVSWPIYLGGLVELWMKGSITLCTSIFI